jgi:hypothetical protein
MCGAAALGDVLFFGKASSQDVPRIAIATYSLDLGTKI